MMVNEQKRYQSDVETNSRPVTIITPEGNEKQVRWMDVVVGDIVKVT